VETKFSSGRLLEGEQEGEERKCSSRRTWRGLAKTENPEAPTRHDRVRRWNVGKEERALSVGCSVTRGKSTLQREKCMRTPRKLADLTREFQRVESIVMGMVSQQQKREGKSPPIQERRRGGKRERCISASSWRPRKTLDLRGLQLVEGGAPYK